MVKVLDYDLAAPNTPETAVAVVAAGAAVFAADVDFGGHKGVNAADPGSAQDLVTKAYGDAHYLGSGAVSSVFGRTGAVVAAANDYSEADLSFTNITTNNVSTSKHGFAPILPNDATKYLDGTGAYSVPGGAIPLGTQLDYVTTNTDLTVTATTAAAAQAFLTGNAVSYNGATRVKLEWWSASVGGTGVAIAELYDGATDVGLRIGQGGGSAIGAPMYGVYFFTPSNASHTYSIKFWRATANMSVAGNGSGVFAPAWLRVTVA